MPCLQHLASAPSCYGGRCCTRRCPGDSNVFPCCLVPPCALNDSSPCCGGFHSDGVPKECDTGMKISGIEPQPQRPERYNIYLDGTFAFALDGVLIAAEGLSVHTDLSPAQVERLQSLDAERALFDTAVRFLTPLPRSRA